jgi:hypothetical protein
MKTCVSCKEDKDVSFFFKRTRSKDGLHYLCKTCSVARNRSWRAKNKEAFVASCKRYYEKNKERCLANTRKTFKEQPFKHRGYELRRKYWPDLSWEEALAEYGDLAFNQNFGCGICKQQQVELVVDHCHATNKVRSLLCKACNLAIGHIKENIESAENLLTYLKKWKVS